jgi:hypothetical protein
MSASARARRGSSSEPAHARNRLYGTRLGPHSVLFLGREFYQRHVVKKRKRRRPAYSREVVEIARQDRRPWLASDGESHRQYL